MVFVWMVTDGVQMFLLFQEMSKDVADSDRCVDITQNGVCM